MQQTAIPYLKSAARLAALVILTVMAVCPQRMQAQGTAFSYQGKLSDGGSPATGTYDFQVAIYDAVSGGNGVGSVLTVEDVAVTGGLFTLYPDFGGGVFTGSARWLEVAVRAGNSTGGFTTLTPRQPVLTTPYAQRALVAAGVPNASISGAQLAAGAVGTTQIANGSITAEKLASGVGGGGGGSTPMGAIVGGFAEDEEDLLSSGFAKVPGLFTEVGGWNKVVTLSAPPEFSSFESAWTGTEWFCLGQFAPGGSASFGYGESFAYLPARFNPSTGQWTQANTNSGPQFMSAGPGVQLIAADSEIYAIGQVDTFLAPQDAFGWRYHTGSGTWTMISTNGFGRLMSGGPSSAPAYVWAGSKLFALGQPEFFSPEQPIRVGLYDPNTTSWSLPSIAPVTNLTLNTKPVIGWTGSEVIVYGKDMLHFGEMLGARLNPVTGLWSTMSTNNGPLLSMTGNPRPVWTGTELFMEGRTNEASSQPVYFLYNPQSDSWRRATAIGSPQPQFTELKVVATFWTGTEVGVVHVSDDVQKKTYVALYNPVTDAWRTFTDNILQPDTAPGIGSASKGVWRDGELLVLGKFKESSADTMFKLLNYRFAPPRLVYLFQKQPVE